MDWKCLNCGEIFTTESKPVICPICKREAIQKKDLDFGQEEENEDE